MKHTFTLAAIAFIFSLLAVQACSEAENEDGAELLPETVPITFSVQGMHCEACADASTQALKSVSGVKDASVSYEEETATVYTDAQSVPDFEEIAEALRRIGYEIEPAD